jgi:hypothetical protein
MEATCSSESLGAATRKIVIEVKLSRLTKPYYTMKRYGRMDV